MKSIHFRLSAQTKRLSPLLIFGTTLLGITACATGQFERYLSQHRWTDAAGAFTADSALLDNEKALFDAGMLFSSTSRGTYDLERARMVLRRLLTRFPETAHRVEATDRLALVNEALGGRDSAAAYGKAVQARIAALAADTLRLHMTIDSLNATRTTVERTNARLEADLRDRDEQLRNLRSELARLKEIDLKPRGQPGRGRGG